VTFDCLEWQYQAKRMARVEYVAAYVTQVCLLDLDYNLPVQVRDQALGADPEDQLPESDVGKEYALAARAADGTLQSNLLTGKPNDTILKLQRTTPYYKVCRDSMTSAHIIPLAHRGQVPASA
jgi:pre-mRNA-splicing factor RBM22/SLT11